MSCPIIVLAYHDLSQQGDFLSWMRVKAEVFDRQIRLFKKIGNFIRPDELYDSSRLKRNRLNLILTFDDGYCNNYHLGFPLIKKHGVPALFFISTSNMQSGEPFWFDRIIQPIQRNSLKSLDLRSLGLKNYQFSTKTRVRWDDLQVLLEDVKKAEAMRNEEIVDDIVQILKKACPSHASLSHNDRYQPLTPQHIAEMHQSGLCFFGSHSHKHTILTSLSDDELNAELTESRRILEEIVGETVNYISYPNGDADKRVKQACCNAGYRYGYTTNKAVTGYYADEMYIPRVLIGGFDSTAKIMWKIYRRLKLLRAPLDA